MRAPALFLLLVTTASPHAAQARSDHQFENAQPSAGDYLSTAIFAAISRTFGRGPVAPHVRLGLGLGRAPCEGDTCGDGLYLRGAVGVSGHLSGPLHLVAETGLSRVGQPFGGAGLSYRLGS